MDMDRVDREGPVKEETVVAVFIMIVAAILTTGGLLCLYDRL